MGFGKRKGSFFASKKGPRWNNGLVRRRPIRGGRPGSKTHARHLREQAKTENDDNKNGGERRDDGDDLNGKDPASDNDQDNNNYVEFEEEDVMESRFESIENRDLLSVRFGFVPMESLHHSQSINPNDTLVEEEGAPRRFLGWLLNVRPTLVRDAEWPKGRSAVNFYFLGEDGRAAFRHTIRYSPYFYLKCRQGMESEVEEALRRRIGNTIECIDRVEKIDLDQVC